MVESLRRMDGAKGRDLYVLLAAAAPNKVLARYMQQRAEMMANYTTKLTDNPINLDVKKITDLCLQGKPQPSYTVEVFHKDNSKRWLEVSEVPIIKGEDTGFDDICGRVSI